MDLTTLGQLKEIGIALTAVVASGYITKYVIDKNKEVFDALISQLKDNQKYLSDFVETNNHGNTERIEKSTEAMAKTSEAIGQHTEVLRRLVDKLDR